VDSDVLGVDTEHFFDASQATKTTIGLMVKSNVVDNILTGSPAALSKKFMKGDVVVQIDGAPVNNKNLIDLLIGCDIPGTIVTVKVMRTGAAAPIEVRSRRKDRICTCPCVSVTVCIHGRVYHQQCVFVCVCACACACACVCVTHEHINT